VEFSLDGGRSLRLSASRRGDLKPHCFILAPALLTLEFLDLTRSL
jgi:hypothetical protein